MGTLTGLRGQSILTGFCSGRIEEPLNAPSSAAPGQQTRCEIIGRITRDLSLEDQSNVVMKEANQQIGNGEEER